MPKPVQKRFPKYSLFIYGEGIYATYLKDMEENFELDGIPVVFVHGNAGRYKQVGVSQLLVDCFTQIVLLMNALVLKETVHFYKIKKAKKQKKKSIKTCKDV